MKKKVAFQKKIEFPTMIGEVSAISLEQDLKFIDDSNVEGNLLLTGKYKLTEASRLEEAFSYKIPTEITLMERLDLDTAKVEITDFSYEVENEDTLVCNIELLVEGLEVIDLEDTDDGELDAKIESVDQEELVRAEKPSIPENVDMVETKGMEEGESDDKKENVVEESVVRSEKKPELEQRECDGDKKELKEIELPMIEKTEEKEEKREEMIEKIDKQEITVEKKMEEKEVNQETSLFFNLNDEQDTYGTFLVYIVRQNETVNSIIEKYHTTLEEIEKYNNLSDLGIGTKLIIPILND